MQAACLDAHQILRGVILQIAFKVACYSLQKALGWPVLQGGQGPHQVCNLQAQWKRSSFLGGKMPERSVSRLAIADASHNRWPIDR